MSIEKRTWVDEGFPVTVKVDGVKSIPLDDDVKEILGKPNFWCGQVAQYLRVGMDMEIERKSEVEQAFVIHWLLNIYLQHGKEWRKIAQGVLVSCIRNEPVT